MYDAARMQKRHATGYLPSSSHDSFHIDPGICDMAPTVLHCFTIVEPPCLDSLLQ